MDYKKYSAGIFGKQFFIWRAYAFCECFFVGVLIDCIKYKEGFAETFILGGFAVVAFLVAISCLF